MIDIGGREFEIERISDLEIKKMLDGTFGITVTYRKEKPTYVLGRKVYDCDRHGKFQYTKEEKEDLVWRARENAIPIVYLIQTKHEWVVPAIGIAFVVCGLVYAFIYLMSI